MNQRIILVYNTSSYLYRLRADLIKDLQERGFEVYAAVPFDRYVTELKEMGVNLIDWPIVGGNKNPIRELLAMWNLYKILRRLKPNIVFNFTIKPVIYSSIAAKLVGEITVFSMIPGRGDLFKKGSSSMAMLRLLIAPFYKLALSVNKSVFFQNNEDRAYFVKHGYVQSNQAKQINGSGVNTNAYPVIDRNKKKRAELDGVQFLMVARLLKDKGIEDYYAAAQSLAKKYPTAHWNLVGGFSTGRNAVKQDKVSAWQAESFFTYYGELNDVKPVLQACDVFVLPSYYNEGLPRSILEAMSTGLAVITTDWPGCRETVIEEQNGYLVPIKQPQELAHAMEKILIEPSLLNGFSLASRSLAVKKFDTSIVNAEIIGTIIA